MTDWSRGFFELAMAQNPKPKTIALVGADAEFAKNAVRGARIHAKNYGLKIVYDGSYHPKTPDFTPIVRAIQARNPDVVYVGSYPPDSVGMVKAVTEIGLKTKLFGGGMVGLQYASVMTALGPKLNGIVNYDFWVPEPTLNFKGVEAFLKKYQAAAKGKGVDPLGYYLPTYGACLSGDPRPGGEGDQEPRSRQARREYAQVHLRYRGRPGEIRPERRMGQDPDADGPVPGHQGQQARDPSRSPGHASSFIPRIGFRVSSATPIPKPGRAERPRRTTDARRGRDADFCGGGGGGPRVFTFDLLWNARSSRACSSGGSMRR